LLKANVEIGPLRRKDVMQRRSGNNGSNDASGWACGLFNI